MKKLEKMERRIQSLEAELKQKQTSASDKSARSATAPASPKNANAAVPADQPQGLRDKPASKSKPLDALTPSPDKPSTFFAGASSVYGTIADGLGYQLQVSSSIEDFAGDFGARTAANTVPALPAGYTGGIDGLNALGFSRPVRGGFAQLNDTLAYAGKLDFAQGFLPGFAGSVSAYYSPNVTPRGAYADTGAVAKIDAKGNLSKGDRQEPHRRAVGLVSWRRRVFLLIRARTRARECRGTLGRRGPTALDEE